jgi:hypothetical protein
MWVPQVAIDSYNNGVRDGFLYGFISGIGLAVMIKAMKIILKNKAEEQSGLGLPGGVQK